MDITYIAIASIVTYCLAKLYIRKGGNKGSVKISEKEHMYYYFQMLTVIIIPLFTVILLLFQELEVISSGLAMILVMFFSNIVNKKIIRKYYDGKDFETEMCFLKYMYVVVMLFMILICILYLNQCNMAMLYFAMLLGKFLWFDSNTINLNKMINEWKEIKEKANIQYRSNRYLAALILTFIILMFEKYTSFTFIALSSIILGVLTGSLLLISDASYNL